MIPSISTAGQLVSPSLSDYDISDMLQREERT